MRFIRTAENIWGLPAGFQRVEFLQSTGTQWINTGVLPANEMEFECKFTFTSLVSSNLTIIGSRDGDKRCQPIGVYNNRWSASLGGSYDANGTSVSANTPYMITSTITNGQTITINVNGSQASTCTSTTGLPAQELYIFGRNFYGNTDPVDSRVNGRLYFLKIKSNDTLVRDFIPCIDPLGVPCMYDLVERKPYYNAGTGTFTVGRQVIPVEYLESSGTQWLKTDYTLTANTKIDIAFSPNQQTTANLWVIGSYVASNKLTGVRITGGTTIDCYINTTISKTVSGSNIGNKYQAVLDGKWTVNGSEGTAVTVSAGLSPLTLFGWNASTTANTYSISGLCSTKIYHCKIWDNGTLVRDFIPCKDENNVGFMFDKVSGTCYLNAGTGSFIVGENKYTSKLRLIKDAKELPAGYKRVDYLASSGSQYINTGYKPNTNTRTVGRCYFNSFVGSNADYIFGVFESPNNYGFNVGSARQYFNVPWGSDVGIQLNIIPQTNKYYEFDISKTGYKINGTSYGNLSTDLVNSARNMYLFWSNGTSASGMNGRIYYLKIWDNGVLVRDFIPVRDENNVGYMFDEVTGQLFGNAGSGSFGIGNDLPTAKVRFIQDVIPSAYLPLKYLQSTGTQWIDTGVYPTQLTEAEYRCAVTGSVANVDSHLFGSRLSANSEAFDLAYMNMTPSNGIEKFRFIHGTTTTQETTTSMTPSQIANPHTYYMSGTSFKVDGSERLSFTTASFTGSYSLWLFGVNNAGSLHNQVRAQRVYKCIIWDNGVPVRDFYPALRKSDNKPGMYDRITKQFFTNQGTGDFNYE